MCTPVHALQERASSRLVVSRRTAQEVRGCCLSSLRVLLPIQQVPVCDVWPLRAPSGGSSWLSLGPFGSAVFTVLTAELSALLPPPSETCRRSQSSQTQRNKSGTRHLPVLVQPAQKSQTAGSVGVKQIQSVPYRKCTLKSVQQPRCNEYGVDRSRIFCPSAEAFISASGCSSGSEAGARCQS